MAIGTVDSIVSSLPITNTKLTGENALAGTNTGSNFWDYFQNALGHVNNLQQEASASAQQMVLGNQEFLHNTMIAYEKANLALQLTVEIRNRLVDAYQEIMRMQM